jgi:hypothetical protein
VVTAGCGDGCNVSCRMTTSALSSCSGKVTSRGCVTSTASAYTVMSAPVNPSFVLVAAASGLAGWRLVADGPQSSPASRIMGSEAGRAPMSMPRCALASNSKLCGAQRSTTTLVAVSPYTQTTIFSSCPDSTAAFGLHTCFSFSSMIGACLIRACLLMSVCRRSR